jgi:O-antigen/teichoic acid export membrane protein
MWKNYSNAVQDRRRGNPHLQRVRQRPLSGAASTGRLAAADIGSTPIDPSTAVIPGASSAHADHLVARNALLLILSQFSTAPLALIVSAMMGRFLGPEDFGVLYLLGTVLGFIFLVVDWGQTTTLTGNVARHPEDAGTLLGSALTFRLGLAFAGGVFGSASLVLLGYPPSYQHPFLLLFLQALLASPLGAIGAVLRGYERMQAVLALNVGAALLNAVIPVCTLLLGWGLSGWLWSSVFSSTLALGFAVALLLKQRPIRLHFRTAVMGDLVRAGTSFMVLAAVLALQPYVDAMILARMAPTEVVGWYAAARRIQNALLLPSTSLAAALYPTLSRLHRDSKEAWAALTNRSLGTIAIFAMPAALGCWLFADVAVSLFSASRFAPAAENLRILSPFVFLLFFNIVLSTALIASGRQVACALTQSACVIVSLIADPLLIPLFQARYGNGGLGVAASTLFSEILMAAAVLWLTPRGTLSRKLLHVLLRTCVAGAAMVLAALATRALPWPASVALALAAYLAVLGAMGGLRSEQIRVLRDLLGSRVRRAP